jgi:hypothetical protein
VQPGPVAVVDVSRHHDDKSGPGLGDRLTAGVRRTLGFERTGRIAAHAVDHARAVSRG